MSRSGAGARHENIGTKNKQIRTGAFTTTADAQACRLGESQLRRRSAAACARAKAGPELGRLAPDPAIAARFASLA